MAEYQSKAAKPPTETKVKAAAYGAGAGAVVAEFVGWLLDNYVLTPKVDGDLPGPVGGFLLVAVPIGMAYLSGWLAKHTPRLAAGGVVPGGTTVTLGAGETVNSQADVAAEVGRQLAKALQEYEKRRGPGHA